MMFQMSAVVSAIIAISQLLKPYIPSKFVPLVSLLLGVVGGILYIPHNSIEQALTNGISCGLAASGLFDVSKVLHPTASTK